MTAPLSSTETYSPFPQVSSFPIVPFGSVKPRGKRPPAWLQSSPKDVWLGSQQPYPVMIPRSASASLIPLAFDRPLYRDRKRVSPKNHSLASAQIASHHEANAPIYYEDVSDYRPRHRYASSTQERTSAGKFLTAPSRHISAARSIDSMVEPVIYKDRPQRPIRPLPRSNPIPAVNVTTMTIVRKPVLSQISTPRLPVARPANVGSIPHAAGETSTVAEATTAEVAKIPTAAITPLASEGHETPASPFDSPWNNTPPDSPSPAGPAEKQARQKRASNASLKRLMTAQLDRPVSSLSSVSVGARRCVEAEKLDGNHQEDGHDNNAEAPALDPFPYIVSLIRYAYNSVTSENIASAKKGGWLLAKFLVILYIATCLWSIVVAIQTAVLKALEPFVRFLGFLHWLTGGAGRL